MALISCPECGRDVSDTIKKCIHCGYKFNAKDRIIRICVTIIFILIMVVVALLFSMSGTYREFVSDQSINEEQLGVIKENINKIDIKANKAIIVEDICNFTVFDYVISDVIEPSDPSGHYYCYEADGGNKYVDVRMKVKNLQSSGVAESEMFDYVILKYDDRYDYYCFLVTEEENGADFNMYPDTIQPLETISCHLLTQMPNAVANSNKSLKMIIGINGAEYEWIIKD